MATQVAEVVGVTGIEEMERQLVELVEHVEREKENTKDIFQQLHSLLFVREQGLLRELDGVVVEAKHELKKDQSMSYRRRLNRQSEIDSFKEQIEKGVGEV